MSATLLLILLLLPPAGAVPGGPTSAVRQDDPQPPDGMVYVPAGEFKMGSNDGNADEAPAHRVHVSAYYIDQHEVTNGQFAEFVRESGTFDEIEGPWFRYYAPGCEDLIAHYQDRYGDKTPEGRDAARLRAAAAALQAVPEGDHSQFPVRGVAWRDAVAYAKWAGKRLPTEAEWEKAARGPKEWLYPWGLEWNAKLCRAGLVPEAGPVDVGSFLDGASGYGCLDMAGNVWEWVSDWYGESYYASSKDAVDPQGPTGLPDGRLPGPSEESALIRSAQQGRESDTRKVVRGGGYGGPLEGRARFDTRCTRRLWSNPSYWHPDVGFRCAMDAD